MGTDSARDVSRRAFLAGLAAVGAGGALAGLSGCSGGRVSSSSGEPSAADAGSGASRGDDNIVGKGMWYSKLTEISPNDVSRVDEADIVVVGSGSSGTFAAIRAAERGAKVIWLEKTNLKGGTSTVTEGFTAFNATPQVETGELTDTLPIFNMLMDWHYYGAKSEAFNLYFDNSNLATDWAIAHGARLKYNGRPQKPHYECYDDDGKWMQIGEGMLEPLWTYGDTMSNLDFRLETPAINISCSGGAVDGVYAQEPDGSIILIKSKAVVMATGGFASNVEMGKEWLRVPANRIQFLGFDGQDGDGINMSLNAGAGRHAPTSVNYGLTTIEGSPWNSMLTIFTVWCPSWRVDPAGTIPAGKSIPFVNQDGRRFYNEALLEDLNTSMLNTAVSSQVKAFAVFDKNHVDTYSTFNEFDYITGIAKGNFRDELSSSSAVHEADTLEELADLMGVDKEGFVKTIAEYNACAEGKDVPDVMGTPPTEMTPVVEPPFYAARITACAYGTHGGVSTDYHCQAVDENGNPVVGLYVAGQDNGSMYFNDYPYGLMGGTCQGGALTTGFVAANSACDALSI